MIVSLNKFILEPYMSEGAMKAKEVNGFARIAQKTEVKGLKLLTDFTGTVNGTWFTFPKGSVAYIKEELLFTQPWTKAVFESAAVEGKFIIVDSHHVDFVWMTPSYPEEA